MRFINHSKQLSTWTVACLTNLKNNFNPADNKLTQLKDDAVLVVHVLVESVSVLDEHAALTEEAQQDVGGPGTHHLSSNTLFSYSQTSTSDF